MGDNKISINIKDEDINYLLNAAHEGGSNYWCVKCTSNESVEKLREGVHDTYYPAGEKAVTLTYEKVLKGLEIMHNKYPQHFCDVSGDFDGTTADVFLQCCLFEEVVYS